MADVAHQGQSGVLNENLLGNDRMSIAVNRIKCAPFLSIRLMFMVMLSYATASWFDHPRDLLNLINVKRDEIKLPIVGIGHSFGGAHLLVFLYARALSVSVSVPN